MSRIKKIKSASDNELVSSFKASKDLEIIGELYNRYVHLVYGLCLKYLKDRDESKDAVNQIFELIIKDIPKFEIANFKSWLYVVAKNHCLMELRKRKRISEKKQDFFHEQFMESTEVLHPIEKSEDEIVHEQLKKCIEKLKQEQRSSIELFYFEKKCYKEISDELNIDEKKVKSFIQNGKRNLKICLEQSAVQYE